MKSIKLPRGEILWVSLVNSSGETEYIVTSKEQRDYYYLYKVENDKLRKLGKNKNPKVLEETYCKIK